MGQNVFYGFIFCVFDFWHCKELFVHELYVYFLGDYSVTLLSLFIAQVLSVNLIISVNPTDLFRYVGSYPCWCI